MEKKRLLATALLFLVLTVTHIETITANAQKKTVAPQQLKLAKTESATKLSLQLDTNTSPIRIGMTAWFKGRLFRSSDNKGIYGREITVYTKNIFRQIPIGRVATSSDGTFRVKYKIPLTHRGTLKIYAKFRGDSRYRGSQKSISVPVAGKKRSAYLFWHDARGQVGKTIAVNVYLMRGNSRSSKGFANKRVYLVRQRGPRFPRPHVSAQIIGRGITDRNGRANIPFKLKDKPMRYDLIAHIGQTHRNNLNTVRPKKSHMLTIEKAKMTFLITGPLKGRIGQTLNYKIRVSRTTDRERLAGIEVSFRGKRAITNSSGEVSFEYLVTSSGGLGRRTIEIRAKGDDYHQEKIHQLRINVLPNTS
jgi:hypothetical protein